MLLVGWDAADWKIINPLIAQGKMPALAGLLANGSHGNLVTLDPPISPMLWTSIATGKRPYKHGIHGFTEASPDGKTARPVRVTSRTAKAVWNILNDNELKTNVIGWWPSHPAEKLYGVAVSNFFGVEVENGGDAILEESIYPPELKEDLQACIVKPAELTSEMLFPFFPDAGTINSANDAILRSVMRILAQTASIHAAATYLMENTEWQFTAVYFDAIDHLCHLAMKYHPPKMDAISEEDFTKYHYIVEAGYRFHDMMLQRLIELAGEDCAIMLVSDHGFESGEKRKLALPQEPGAPALEHNPYGVFIASGPGFKHEPVYGASLLDITPTILSYFNLPQGQDMDGKVLPVFEEPILSKPIHSYENLVFGKDPDVPQIRATPIDAQLLNQLEALGYIDTLENRSAKSLLAENEYYLARSLADGGLLEQALETMEKLVFAFPDVERYANFKASLLLRRGDFNGLESFISTWKNSSYRSYLTGLFHLQSGKPKLALATFDKLAALDDDALIIQMARASLQAGDVEQAQNLAAKAKLINPHNNAALNLLGELALQQENWEEALENFFASLKLLYYQPQVHYNIGTALYWLGYYADAITALKLTLQFRPGHLAAQELLREILIEKLDRSEEWEEFQTEKLPKPIIVVTGHPRSGTSMMMQMLQAGGIEVLTDEVRTSDENNKKGYLELEAVKKIAQDQSFLHESMGKAVKIVIPLLRIIQPFYPMKVIWMEREHASTLKSQQKMRRKPLGHADFALVSKMMAEEERMLTWLNLYPHISYLNIKYEQALLNPADTANKISRFLNLEFDVIKAAKSIDQSLKHY